MRCNKKTKIIQGTATLLGGIALTVNGALLHKHKKTCKHNVSIQFSVETKKPQLQRMGLLEDETAEEGQQP